MTIDKTRGRSYDWIPGHCTAIRFTRYAIFEAEEGHAAREGKAAESWIH